MDPFLESQEWEDFHTRFNTVIGEHLGPRLEPRYVVRIERRVYVEHLIDDPSSRRTGVAVMWTASAEAAPPPGRRAATIDPVECLLPIPEERQEVYLVIRDRETMEVVTVMETPSPANKRPGGDGRREYLVKRESMLRSQAHIWSRSICCGEAPASRCSIPCHRANSTPSCPGGRGGRARKSTRGRSAIRCPRSRFP